jgi:hypothetical protein
MAAPRLDQGRTGRALTSGRSDAVSGSAWRCESGPIGGIAGASWRKSVLQANGFCTVNNVSGALLAHLRRTPVIQTSTDVWAHDVLRSSVCFQRMPNMAKSLASRDRVSQNRCVSRNDVLSSILHTNAKCLMHTYAEGWNVKLSLVPPAVLPRGWVRKCPKTGELK